jgi:hypothetical protein
MKYRLRWKVKSLVPIALYVNDSFLCIFTAVENIDDLFANFRVLGLLVNSPFRQSRFP